MSARGADNGVNRYLTDKALEKRAWHWPLTAFSLFLGLAGVETWIQDSPADEDFFIWLLAHCVVMALMLWPLAHVVLWRLRQRGAKAIAGKLAGLRESVIPRYQLSKLMGMKNADARIEKLIKKGFLRNMEMGEVALMLNDREMSEEEALARAASPAPASDPAPDDVIGRIRLLNDGIDDEAVSRHIERIEKVTASILETVNERPERATDTRRFMNYYLPTTMKLLESYRLMEKQSYQGENIVASRKRIEEMLEKIVIAAEKQQDRLFSSEALDIEAEISVLETMMASEGLTGQSGFGRQAGSNAI